MSFISMIGGGNVEDVLATNDWFVDQHIKGRLWRIGKSNYQNNSPTQIGANSDWSRLFRRSDVASPNRFLTTRDNRLYAYGENYAGSLGLGDTTTRASPTQVGSDKSWREIAGNVYNTVGIKNDGTLWTWGYGYYGHLLNTTSDRYTPGQVGIDTNWKFATAPNYQSLALAKTNGDLYVQGAIYSGYSGSNIAALNQMNAAGPWGDLREMVSSNGSILIIGEDGKMYVFNGPNFRWVNPAWINNVYDQNTGQSGSPVPLLYGSEQRSWKSAAIGGYVWGTTLNEITIIAIADDGTLWGFGANTNYRLGLGDTTLRSTFTQIGTSSDWKQVVFNFNAGNAMAVKYDGTLWAWGNNNGMLGTGDQATKTVPTRVGTANYWKEIITASSDEYIGISYY